MPINSDLRNKYLQGARTPLHCWRTGTEIIRRYFTGRPTCHEPIRHQPSATHNATTSQERS